MLFNCLLSASIYPTRLPQKFECLTSDFCELEVSLDTVGRIPCAKLSIFYFLKMLVLML